MDGKMEADGDSAPAKTNKNESRNSTQQRGEKDERAAGELMRERLHEIARRAPA